MTPQVTVGVNGSEQSAAAVLWAADEAVRRELPLHVVHVEEWRNPETQIPEAYVRASAEEAERLLSQGVEQARTARPGLQVTGEHLRGRVAEHMLAAADAAEVTVLGSRGLGGLLGFVLNSVSLSVLSATRRPLVLVRRPRTPDERAGASGDIVVGIDRHHPSDALLEFAFAHAARTGLPLRFLHSWTAPVEEGHAEIVDPGLGEELGRHYRADLDTLLQPWRTRYPGVDAAARAIVGSAAHQMIEASRDVALVVVGRRDRPVPVGPHLGHVTHAVIHHSPAPVAVVPLPAPAP